MTSPPLDQVHYRSMGYEERRLAADLLPEVMEKYEWSRCFCAVTGRQDLLGVALLVKVRAELRVKLYVVAGRRREGIARKLLDMCRDIGRQLNNPRIGTLDRISPKSEALAICERMGFKAKGYYRLYESSIDRYFQLLDKIYRRLVARNRIPEDIEVVTLDQAPLPEVVELIARQMNKRPEDVEGNIRWLSIKDPQMRSLSHVILREGRVIAAMINCTWNAETLWIDSVVVDAQSRNSWPNIVVRHACFQKAIEKGLKLGRFQAQEQIADTHKSAAKNESRLLEEYLRPILKV